MTDTNSTLIDSFDKLSEAKAMVSFVQSISCQGRTEDSVTLHPEQLKGLFYALQSAIDRIGDAQKLIENARGAAPA